MKACVAIGLVYFKNHNDSQPVISSNETHLYITKRNTCFCPFRFNGKRVGSNSDVADARTVHNDR